ncbi:DNA-binding protein [Sorangium sp. So ce118]
MRIIMEIREGAFRTPKTPQQIADEMRQAAAVFWVARGDVAPEAVNDIAAATLPEKEGTLKDLLLSMPDVGEDADFERPMDYGRRIVEFD